MINNKPLPTQPTLQFVDVPEWFINQEAGHEMEDRDKKWLDAHIELVNASKKGKLVYSSAGHCLHIIEYERVAEEIKLFINELGD